MPSKIRGEEPAASAEATAAAPAASASELAAPASVTLSTSRAMADTANLAIDRAASSAKTGVAQAAGVEQSQVRMQKGLEKVMKTAEEIVAFGQGNVAAFVRSGQILAAGLQDLGKQVAASAQGQIADTMSAFKAIAGARSVKDAIELQTTLARTTMEKALAESGRITERSLKLSEQALAPVAARVSLAVEKFGRAA